MRYANRLFPYFILLAGLGAGHIAHAHNSLTSSLPEDKAILQIAPETLTLTFSDTTWISEVRLLTGSDTVIVLENLPAEASTQFVLPLPALEEGFYEVTWKVEGEDTHIITGDFSFSVSAITGQ
jgi:methionine-rich copper-binding protein CopC